MFEFKIRPNKKINYSLIHNNQSVFTEFRVHNRLQIPLKDLRIEVRLHVGGEECVWRTRLDSEEPVIELSDRVVLPLTARLVRSLREGIRSVISVSIDWGKKGIFLDTYAVTLLAIDEWVDTGTVHQFLPSFVLPRDPVVEKIIDAAQPYLQTLSDDSSAGFDGYQQVNPKKPESTEAVDLQVQAIWAALIYDYSLSYINPPPTFTENSQRLRFPSNVIGGRRGTCIDLALLLAACLENVEIYPAIILLKDHAFPAYWRSTEGRDRFLHFALKTEEIANKADHLLTESPASTGSAPSKLWVFYEHAEVMEAVRSGDLVPLESVWLTERRGFWDAVDAGVENLRNRSEFEVLVDVRGARDYNVTPLPTVESGS